MGEVHSAAFGCRQSIFCDEVDFTRKSWDGISAEAKEFVAALLNKDPSKRPTAKQVLHASFSHYDNTCLSREKSCPVLASYAMHPCDYWTIRVLSRQCCRLCSTPGLRVALRTAPQERRSASKWCSASRWAILTSEQGPFLAACHQRQLALRLAAVHL